MLKEDITAIAQLLTAIKDSVKKLEEAQKRKDIELYNKAKSEILKFKGEIDKLI